VGKSVHNNGRAPQAGLRPSLLTTSTSAAEHNILDAMGQGAPGVPAPARPLRRTLWLLPALAILVGGLWAMLRPAPTRHTPAVQVHTPTPAPVQPVAPTAAPRPALAAAAEAAPTGPSATPATTPFDALGDNTTRPDPAPEPHPLKAQEQAADRTAAMPKQPEPAATTRVSKAKTPASAGPVAKAPKAASTTQTAQKSANPKPASKPATQAARSTTPPKPLGRDPDAELIGAIMKHLGTGAAAVAAPPSARSAQTIAELVQSCQSKDAIEALLCQRRICEGSWGKAQACPMSKAPQQVSATAKR